MQILSKAFGDYQTNCYIVKTDKAELIIDPGIGAFEWIKKEVSSPIAILNTHGHFDHVWDNQKIKERFNIPLYTPKADAFMLKDDIFGFNMPSSEPDFEVLEESFDIGDIKVKFWSFPGHTPGCSAIQIGDSLFSGDFIFKGSIGRVDFPYSSPEEMKKSLKKLLDFKEDLRVYPGHGPATTVFKEKNSLRSWLKYLD